MSKMSSEEISFTNLFNDSLISSKTSFKAGQFISEADDKPADVLLITKGFVKVVERSIEGFEVTLIFLSRGNIFPLIWAFDHPKTTNYSYVALTDCELEKVPTENFKACLANKAIFTKTAMEMFVYLFWDSLERIKGNRHPQTIVKLQRVLPYLAGKLGTKVDDQTYLLPREVTQGEIAKCIGVSRESVSAHFQSCKEHNIVTTNSNRISIHLDKLPKDYVYEQWFE